VNAATIIGYTTSDGSAYCLADEPKARAGSTLTWGPVFADQSGEFEDGGLDCDRCGAVIVESGTCRACDRSLRDEHDEFSYGTLNGTDRRLVTETRCRPYQLATIRIREQCGSAWSIGTAESLVPYDEDPAEALDVICAAYAGTIATFDVLSVQEVAAS